MSLATADRLAHEPLLKPIEVQRHRDQQTNDCPRINEAHPARTDSNFTISTHSFEGSLPRVTLLSNGLDPDDVIDKLVAPPVRHTRAAGEDRQAIGHEYKAFHLSPDSAADARKRAPVLRGHRIVPRTEENVETGLTLLMCHSVGAQKEVSGNA